MEIRNLLYIYALLVCLITTLIMIVSASLGLNYVTNLAIPTYRYYASLQKFDSNESYVDALRREQHIPPLTKITEAENESLPSPLTNLSAPQITEKRTQERDRYLKEKRIENVMDLLSAFQWFLVSLVFFFFHWRLYKSKSTAAHS